MWSPRLALVVGVLTLLPSCGFRPMYATATDHGSELGAIDRLAAIEVAAIPDREGQELRNQLRILLDPEGRNPPPVYRLSVVLDEDRREFAVDRRGFATRLNLEIKADYRLVESTTGVELVRGRTRTTSSLNVVDSRFSTLTGEQAARSRAVRQIAHDIRRRLGAYLVVAPDPHAPPAATAGG